MHVHYRRISEEDIEHVRNSYDIVDVISKYVDLKKKGRTHFGRCPFHSEKTPSFAVSPDKQIYHCFGCGAGGNLFSFLMEIEGWGFIETVGKLAEDAGVQIDWQEADVNSDNKLREQAYKAHDLAAKYYNYILTETEFGKDAMKYLIDRGFTVEIIKEFQLGYAPSSIDTLQKFLHKRGITIDEMDAAGLVSYSEYRNTYIDRFRSRIMFPIWDGQGRVIAFGGRIHGEGEPKYLNSSDTLIYNKRLILYNFHRARNVIRSKGEAIICEGYIDVITAYQKGIKNVVASLGTALTEDQAKLIIRNTDKIYLMYDGDNAGINAAIRAHDVFPDESQLSIVELPDQMDPDDYLRKYDLESFEKLLAQAVTKTQLQTKQIKKNYNFDDGEEKVNYAMEVIKLIADVNEAPRREYLLKKLHLETNLSIESLEDALSKERMKQIKEQNKKVAYKRNIASRTDENYSYKLKGSKIDLLEKKILEIMLYDKKNGQVLSNEIKGNFVTPEYALIASRIYAIYDRNEELSLTKLLIDFQDNSVIVAFLTELEFTYEENTSEFDQQLIDNLIGKIKKRTLENKLQSLKLELESVSKIGDEFEVVEILEKIHNLQQDIKLLSIDGKGDI